MRRAALVAFFAVPLLVGVPAAAQDDDGGGTSEIESVEFEAVTGAQQEDVSGLGLMVGAYAVVLALLLLYVLRLGLIHKNIAADVDRLERSLAAFEGGGGKADAKSEADDDDDDDG